MYPSIAKSDSSMELTAYKDNEKDCVWQQATIPRYVQEGSEELDISNATTVTLVYTSHGTYEKGKEPSVILDELNFQA